MIENHEIGETTLVKKSVLSLHPSAITSLFVSPPSDLFSSCIQGFIRRWDLNDGTSSWERREHNGPINGISLIGENVFSVSFDGTISVTDSIRGRTIGKLRLGIGPLQFLCPKTESPIVLFTGTASGAVIFVRLPNEVLQPNHPKDLKLIPLT